MFCNRAYKIRKTQHWQGFFLKNVIFYDIINTLDRGIGESKRQPFFGECLQLIKLIDELITLSERRWWHECLEIDWRSCYLLNSSNWTVYHYQKNYPHKIDKTKSGSPLEKVSRPRFKKQKEEMILPHRGVSNSSVFYYLYYTPFWRKNKPLAQIFPQWTLIFFERSKLLISS